MIQRFPFRNTNQQKTMDSELIYLVLFGLMVIFCCYSMMRMMSGSEKSK